MPRPAGPLGGVGVRAAGACVRTRDCASRACDRRLAVLFTVGPSPHLNRVQLYLCESETFSMCGPGGRFARSRIKRRVRFFLRGNARARGPRAAVVHCVRICLKYDKKEAARGMRIGRARDPADGTSGGTAGPPRGTSTGTEGTQSQRVRLCLETCERARPARHSTTRLLRLGQTLQSHRVARRKRPRDLVRIAGAWWSGCR